MSFSIKLNRLNSDLDLKEPYLLSQVLYLTSDHFYKLCQSILDYLLMGRVVAFVFVIVYDLILIGCPVFTRPSLGVAYLIATLSHYVIDLRE